MQKQKESEMFKCRIVSLTLIQNINIQSIRSMKNMYKISDTCSQRKKHMSFNIPTMNIMLLKLFPMAKYWKSHIERETSFKKLISLVTKYFSHYLGIFHLYRNTRKHNINIMCLLYNITIHSLQHVLTSVTFFWSLTIHICDATTGH